MIETTGLTKKFNSYKKAPGLRGSLGAFIKRGKVVKTAVDSVDLHIEKGEIVGLLGPNGAGKTTLMKMFTGIIVPSSGEISVLGFNPWERDKEFRKKIALVMGQKSQLWWDLPAMDSFQLLQKYYEVSDKDFTSRIGLMGEILSVQDLLHIQVRKLSLGERMKMELMASLIHSPDIIFLDEPTIGLDLVAQENIRNFIKAYHQENDVTILLTSHYMADVQELCKRLVLIFEGKKAYDGRLDAFEKILGHEKRVQFRFKEEISNQEFFNDFAPVWNDKKTQVDLRIPEKDLCSLSAKILTQFPIKDFHTEKLPIEFVMKTLMNNPEILHAHSKS